MQLLARPELPYLEYWAPLFIGMVVGAGAIMLGRLMSTRRASARTPADLSSVNDLVQCRPPEQRQTLRRDGNPTEVYLAPPGYKDRPSRGWIVDRSLGGIGLMVNDEVKIGTVLSILPVKAPEMTHWVDIEVKSCRPTSEGWEIGCQFVKTPPFSILLMFG
ncbi:MAG: hypothetical protein HY040_27530 [Planctomycetes bacterium]|nr:hypothetical protein [Planctomycetota bacterium]